MDNPVNKLLETCNKGQNDATLNSALIPRNDTNMLKRFNYIHES